MALLKHPYELSIWDILPEEKKIAIIGSDTMTSPIRAIDPILVRNVNGTVTLTFKMYTRYFDEDKEQFTENPFLSMLMAERALKLKYKDKWYDLVIKNRQESSDQKMYSYTAKSAHICELSKTGFDLEFKTELQNNQGTITELGEKIMEGTDWKIGSSDIVRAYQDDQLILCQASSGFSGMKMLDKTSANVGADKQFYAFYTDWKAFQEEEKELQILLIEYSEIIEGKNLDDLILDGEYYDDNGILTIGDNVLVQYSNDTKNNITKVQISNYRGRRLVKKQKTRFNTTLDRYVNIYTSGNTNEDGSFKEDIEGYSKTEFLSPNFVENLIVNSKDFESTAGWYGKIEEEEEDITQYQPTVELDYYPPISQETDWEKVAVTSRLKITPKSTDIGNKVYNTGLRSNFSKIEDFAAGEQLLLCYNFVNENNEVLGQGKLADVDVTFSIDGFSSSSFDKNEIGEIERKDIPKQIFTAINKVTKEELKKAQFTITFNEAGPYYLKDISLFRYVKDDATVITINEDETKTEKKYTDIIIYPGDVPDNKPIVTNFYYDVKENANNKAEEYAYLNSNGTYTPIYNDANYEKIASIEKSESNRFNLIQELCETFECWADFVIEHDSNGKVLSKTIYFKEYIGENRYTGFKYGINLKSIQRTIDSEQIATKIIVKPNSNEHGENGFCTIARATENPLGGTYLLNFDYYVSQGLLKKEDLDNDLYTKFIAYEYEYDEEGNIKLDKDGNPIKKEKYSEGFYDLMYKNSRRRDEIIAERTAFSASYLEGIAAKEVADETLQATEQLLSDLKQQYKQYSGVEWPNISEEHKEQELDENGNVIKTTIADNEIYKFITKIQQAQSMRDDAEEDAVKYEDYTEDNYEAKLKKYNNQVQDLKIEELEDDFFNKYHNFIQEGTWNSEEYWDDNEYYIDALDVARTSSRPKVTYTINVIDVSVLDDYEGYEFDVGDKTFMEDPEFFGYVFYKSGEEFYKKPYKEEVVITEISEHLEAPEANQIKVQNYKTQFDDLFQRITAQTQSLQYASGGYNRASAAINSDGTIDGELLQNSLLNYALALMNPENKGVIWDRDGIRIIDRENTNKILKLTGGALQISNDGGNTWAIAINGNGINAGLVTTGSINTEEIMIGNSQNFSFRWDASGLNAYTRNDDESYNYGKFVRFDQYGLYGYSKGTVFNPQNLSEVKENADFGLTWDGFFLKSKHKNKDGTYNVNDKGYIEIDSQEDFRVIDNNGEEVIKIGLLENTAENPYLYGIRIYGSKTDDNGKRIPSFITDKNGDLTITGTITATGGDIGGWTINTGNLSSVQGEEGIILDAANSQIYSQKYFTSNAGNGWMINNDEAIFNNITLRGALKCAVLEYAEVSAVGGILMVRPATSIKRLIGIETEIELDGGSPDEYSGIYTLLVVEVEDNKLFKTLDATNFPEIYAGDWCKLTTEADFDKLKMNSNNQEILYSGINTNLFRCVWSGEETEEEEDDKGNLVEITHKYLGFDITSLTDEEINELKNLNFEGLGIVNLGNDGSIGLALNSSDNRAMVPKESFSVFTLETDSGWKYLKPHIILGKIPEDAIYDESMHGKYGLYADAVQLTGRITATSGYIGNATDGWVIESNNISHGTGKTLYLGTKGISAEIGGISRSNLVFKAGANFGVTRTGTLYANGVDIQGKIVATEGEFTGKISSKEGDIGGWTIGNKILWDGTGSTVVLDANSTDVENSIGGVIRVGLNNGNYNFRVLNTGTTLIGYAGQDSDNNPIYNVKIGSNGDVSITGNITATSGVIGGCEITDGKLVIKSANISSLAVSKISGGTNNKNITFNGKIVAPNIEATGSIVATSGQFGNLIIKQEADFVDEMTVLTSSDGVFRISPDGFQLSEETGGINLSIIDPTRRLQEKKAWAPDEDWSNFDPFATPQVFDYDYEIGGKQNSPAFFATKSGGTTWSSNIITTDAEGTDAGKFGDLCYYTKSDTQNSEVFLYSPIYEAGSSLSDLTYSISFWAKIGTASYTSSSIEVFAAYSTSSPPSFSTYSATNQWKTPEGKTSASITKDVVENSGTWQYFCFEGTVPKGTKYVCFRIDNNGSSSSSTTKMSIRFNNIQFSLGNPLLGRPAFLLGYTRDSEQRVESFVWGNLLTFDAISTYPKTLSSFGGDLYGTWESESAIAIRSSIEVKNSIEPYSLEYSILFDNLKPIRYKYNDGTSNRYHTGFIAQEVEEAILKSGLTTQDFAGFIRDYKTETDPTTGEEVQVERCYLRYEEFIALNTNEIQKLKKRVTELETQLAELLNQ